MNLTDQVCSLDLAKKLKELGVKQESLFHRVKVLSQKGQWFVSYDIEKGRGVDLNTAISAFTVAELGEIFPPNVQLPFKRTSTTASGGTIEIWYWSKSDARIMEGNEADARAKMLIYLIKNKLVTV